MTRISLPNEGNKYGAKKTEYNGVTYDSKFEAEYAQTLDLRVKAGDILNYQRQVPFPLEVNGQFIGKYVMDFVVYHPDARIELVEIKGFETAVYKLKAKLLRAIYLEDNPRWFYTVVKR